MLRLFDSAKEGRLSLFIGAGISHDPPSNLPLAKQFVGSILWHLCGDSIFSEQEKQALQYSIENTRPEMLISMLYDILGEETYMPLKFFSGIVPNPNHLIIANLALKGCLACIITTNLDCALEYALNKVGVKWRLFGTEREFNEWDGSYHPLPIFKLHGTIIESFENDRKQPIVEFREVIVKLEEVGKPLSEPRARVLKRLLQETDFLVIGYSGRDDFDIYPLFYNIQSSRQLVWLSHTNYEKQYEAINGEQLKNREQKDHIDLLLVKRGELGTRVYTHTFTWLRSFARIFNEKIDEQLESISTIKHSANWDSKVRKWAYSLKDEKSPLPYLVKGNILGSTLVGSRTGNESIAIENFKRAIELSKGDSKYEAQARIFLATQEGILESWDNAEKNLLLAIKIAEEIDNKKLLLEANNELGIQLGKRGEIDKALEVLQRALSIVFEDSLLQEKARILHNMGTAYDHKRDLNKAIECWKKSAQYRQECGDVVAMAITLHNLAYAYTRLGLLDQAIKCIAEGYGVMCKVYGKPPDFYMARILGVLLTLIPKVEKKKDFHIPEPTKRILDEIIETLK
jgi:tetratricopeptide (TPR) repeat protein